METGWVGLWTLAGVDQKAPGITFRSRTTQCTPVHLLWGPVFFQPPRPHACSHRTRIGCELVMQLRMALNNWLFCLHLLRARLYRRLISDLWLFLRCLKANVPVPVEKLLKFCFPFPSSPSPPQQQNPWNKTTAPTFYEFPHWDLVVIFVKLDKVLHMLNPRT